MTRIACLSARGWRNLQPLALRPAAGFNVLAGDNGQGKTNLIEAIHALSTLRSWRTARLDEAIHVDAAEAALSAQVDRDGSERSLELRLRRGGREARLDGKVAPRASAFFGVLSAVLFVPEDLLLPRGAPAARRRFLDRAVFACWPGYLAEVHDYERALRARNALLRSGRATPAMLGAFDVPLAALGARLVARRQALIARLAPRFAAGVAAITGRPASLRYVAGPTLDPSLDLRALEAALASALETGRARDLALGRTGDGPHAHDLDIRFDGRPARRYASQGELRAIVLALKMAELEEAAVALGEAPVLLLDDVASELDAGRCALFFRFVAGVGCQCFVTTARREVLPIPGEVRELEVREGNIAEAAAGARSA